MLQFLLLAGLLMGHISSEAEKLDKERRRRDFKEGRVRTRIQYIPKPRKPIRLLERLEPGQVTYRERTLEEFFALQREAELTDNWSHAYLQERVRELNHYHAGYLDAELILRDWQLKSSPQYDDMLRQRAEESTEYGFDQDEVYDWLVRQSEQDIRCYCIIYEKEIPPWGIYRHGSSTTSRPYRRRRY